jgi:hypothetical protein
MTTKKPGRPAYEADDKTRAQVKMLAAMGIPDYDIAKVIGLSGPTMRKYYMAGDGPYRGERAGRAIAVQAGDEQGKAERVRRDLLAQVPRRVA